MPENPETLNSKFDKAGHGDGSLNSLERQIEMHKHADANKSALDKLVQLVYHKDGESLDHLTQLKQDAQARASKGGAPALEGMRQEISQAIVSDRDAVKTQNEVNFYAGSFIKAVPLFAGAKSRVMLAGSIAAYGLDAVHDKDTAGEAATNLLMGGAKGFALKKTFDIVGGKTFSLVKEGEVASTASKYASIGLKGMTLGTASRVFETGLTSSTYIDQHSGKLSLDSFGSGLGKTFSSSIDGKAMVMDAGLFMGAHGAFSGLAKVGSRAFAGSAIAENLTNSSIGKFGRESQILSNMGMGSTFGFSSGATGEFMRQKETGEYDVAKILKRGALQAITDGAAGATGSTAMHFSQIRPMDVGENFSPARVGRAFAGEEVTPPGADKVAEPLIDKVAPDKVEPDKVEPTPAQLVEMQPKVENVVDTRLHPVHESLQENFVKASSLAVKAVDAKATPEDVVAFFEYAAGEGRSVRVPMESLAKQAKDFANVPMEKLIKEAYNSSPETIATLKQGVEFAQAAAKNDASAMDVYKLLDYAYGHGRSAEVPLRMVAELAGDHGVNHIIQEAYAGAGNLTRVIQRIDRITDPIPQPVKESFRNLMSMPVTSAAEHMQFRESAKQWVQDNPDFTDLMKRYGNQTRNGVQAAVIDSVIGTNILSRFPDRSVTTANLLEELEAATGRRNLTENPDGLVQNDLTQNVQTNEGPKTVRADSQVINDTQEPGAYNADAAASNRIEAARVLAERNALQGGDQAGISHMDGRAVITPETLIKEFQQAEGNVKQVKGTILSEFIGKMSDSDFADWLTNLYKPTEQPGMHPDVNNLAMMHIGNGRVLNRAEVRDALSNPEKATIDIPTLRKFLAAPEKTDPGTLSQAEMAFIGLRLHLAYERMQTRNDMNPETAGQPVDNMAVLKEALPNNYLKSLRDRFATPATDGSGAFEYPAGFDQNLANWLEAARLNDMKSPKYRPPRTNTSQLSDRLNVLDLALDVQNAGANPKLVTKLLELGSQNHYGVKTVLEKLDPTTSAPEWAELLNLTAPRTNSLDDIRGLLDAVQFANKSNQNANKARDTGKDATFHDTTREVNEAFALSVVDRLIPRTDPGYDRAHKIVSGIVAGKIRDPRPEMPGGQGGGFQRGGPGGKPPFRPRGGDTPAERPRVEQPLRGEEPNNWKPKQPVQQTEAVPVTPVSTAVETPVETAPQVNITQELSTPVNEAPVVLEDQGGISAGLADALTPHHERAATNSGIEETNLIGTGVNSGLQHQTETHLAPELVIDQSLLQPDLVTQPEALVNPVKTYTVEDAESGKYGGKAKKQRRNVVEDDEDDWGNTQGRKRDRTQRGGKRDYHFKRGLDE